VADNEISLDRQVPVVAEKQADKPKKEKDGAHPPLLIEFIVTVSVIFLVLVFLTIVGISLVTGASLLAFMIRTSISILVIGIILTIIVRQIYFGMLPTEIVAEESPEQKQSVDNAESEMQNPAEVK
jgi:hypothetical protein